MQTLYKICLVLLIIGGLNWGLVGLFSFNLVGWLFGGVASVLSRIIFVIVGVAAICAIITGMREDGLMDPALVGCMLAHYDEIMEKTRVRCQPVLEIYQKLQADYNAIYAQYAPVRA